MSLLMPVKAQSRPTPQPSAGVWPGLFEVSNAPVHAAVAKWLVKAAVRKLPITLAFPDGATWGAGGPVLQVVRPTSFFRRVGTEGLIGFGEAWMTGDITTGGWGASRPAASFDATALNAATDELAALLTVMARRMSVLVPEPLQRLRRTWQSRPPREEENTLTGARENIHRHYDLSNDLFQQFLDKTMTYSSAWYEFGDHPAADLQKAQLRKIDGILDLARVRPDSRILEIGSGWGGLAIRAAAERGAQVTTLTLSEAQKDLAQQRIAQAGLSHLIDVRLEDYRAHAATHSLKYDAVVSVEMIEAVGEKYWPDYFGCVDRMLLPGGRLGLQAITIAHDRLLETRNGYTLGAQVRVPRRNSAFAQGHRRSAGVGHHSSGSGEPSPRAVLCADPGAVAAPLQRPSSSRRRPRIRRDLHPDVELLSRLFPGRVCRRISG